MLIMNDFFAEFEENTNPIVSFFGKKETFLISFALNISLLVQSSSGKLID